MTINNDLRKIKLDIQDIKKDISDIKEMIRASIMSQLIKDGTIKMPSIEENAGVRESSFKITTKTQEELDAEAKNVV